jgi:hypothetical protein
MFPIKILYEFLVSQSELHTQPFTEMQHKIMGLMARVNDSEIRTRVL